MALDGIIFDLDGTLIDTNHLHTRAWAIAFEKFGYHLGEDRISLEIGKGGSMLVPTLVGDEAEAQHGDELRDVHGKEYRKLIKDGVGKFPAVEDLMAACRDRGLRIAVATASKQENLEKVIAAAELDLDSLADEVVTDTDVEKSKPHADVVVAAYEKLGLGPGQCVMIGDTPYDAQAAAGGGVACIGLMTGVHGEDAMRAAGVRGLYQDAADLHVNLDEALANASPGEGSLTPSFLDELMSEAIDVARSGMAAGDVASGAVLARSDGTIIETSRSMAQQGGPLAHAVVTLLVDAGASLFDHDDLVLATTHPLCMMCMGAVIEARIDTIAVALAVPDDRMIMQGMRRNRHPRIIRGVRRDDVKALVEEARRHHS